MTTNNHPANGPVSLFTTPPAPGVHDRYIFEKWWESQNGTPLDGWDSLRTTDGYCDDGIDGQFDAWNACRVAMLQVENHTEQHLDMVDHSGDANKMVDYRLPFDQWLSQQNEPIDVDCGCVSTEAFYHWLRVAYEAGKSPVTPDGWQLVPKEPTEAMNKAGWAAMNEHDAINPTYRAMLAAAPQQENV